MRTFFKRKLPALLLALLLLAGTVPAAGAAASDIVLKVAAGKTVDLDEDVFEDLFVDWFGKGSDLYSVTFDPEDSYRAATGYLYYDYGGKSEKQFKSDLDDYDFYCGSHKGDYSLDKLTFAANKTADGDTVKIKFEAYGKNADGRSCSEDGVLEIRITGGSSATSTVDEDTITYRVTAGGEVKFDGDDFDEVFHNTQADRYELQYVVFDNPKAADYTGGKVYWKYGKNSAKAFARTDFEGAGASDKPYTFYYEDSDEGDYALSDLSFVADSSFKDDVKLSFTAYGDGKKVYGTLVIILGSGSSSSIADEDADIEYLVEPGKEKAFNEKDFEKYFAGKKTGTFTHIVVTKVTNLSNAAGTVYYRYGSSREVKFSAARLKEMSFYYGDNESWGDYPLYDLSFVAAEDFNDAVILEFRAYSGTSRYVDGVLKICSTKAPGRKGDIDYLTASNANVPLKANDFWDYYEKEGPSGKLLYVTFTGYKGNEAPNGLFCVNQGKRDERYLSWNTLTASKFYYSVSDFDELDKNSYALSELTFSAGKDFTSTATVNFRAYSSSSRYAEGTVTFSPYDGTGGSTVPGADPYILYSTTYSANLQLNPNDFDRYLKRTYPSATLQTVRLNGAPSTGELYYNYYNASAYGGKKAAVTAANAAEEPYYFSPANTSQRSLNELTFVPRVQKANYCEAIPFTAYSTGGQAVSGTVLISITLMQVADVYGAVTKGTTVNFPVSSFYNVLLSATGMTFDSIRLLRLPAAASGTVYVGSGTTRADTSVKYTYKSGSLCVSQLRFIPASGFTGTVEIPYMAYGSDGNAIATGKFCFGVVTTLKKFSDITSSTWCYKYVTELSDVRVIEGYSDGSFRPNNSVSWGAALKLVMLAAGYPEQAPTSSSSVFSGYVDKARADGLVVGTIDPGKAITRLQVAQLAAKALKLSITNLPTQKPFTDTSDPYLQALNATGIVGGYFNNGTYTYKPTNTLTRGQLSAIVWRMQQYRK